MNSSLQLQRGLHEEDGPLPQQEDLVGEHQEAAGSERSAKKLHRRPQEEGQCRLMETLVCVFFVNIILTPPLLPSTQKPPAAAPSTGHSPLPGQQAESSQCSDLSGYKGPPSPPPQGSPCPYGLVPGDPGQWGIQDVYQFISSLPGRATVSDLPITFPCRAPLSPLVHTNLSRDPLDG